MQKQPWPPENTGVPVRLPFGLDQNILNILTVGVIGANVWTPFTREYQGVHWPGWAGLVCWIGMTLVAACSPDQEAVLGFVGLWMVVLMVKRGAAAANFKKGVQVVSDYSGEPVFIMKLLKCSVMQAKSIESLLCLGASFAMLEVQEHIGFILIVGAISLAITRIHESTSNYFHDVVQRDAVVRMKNAMERYKRGGEY